MKKYDVIYADPGWKYGSNGVRSGRYAPIDYKQMKTKDICEIPVVGISKENCALFMWVTGSFMPDALQVGSAWGFKHVRIDKVWKKITKNGKPHAACGPWGMSDAEFIVLFVRGKMCSKQIGKRNQYTVVDAEYTGVHSGKPEVFAQLIEKRFPEEFKKIELFARNRRPGWDVFGNEVEGSIELGEY